MPDTTDDLDALPARMLAKVRCDQCGEPLLRADTGWVCPKGLSHTPLIPDLALLERIDPVLPAVRGTDRTVQLRQVLKLLTRLSRKGLLPRADGGGPRKRLSSR